MRYYCNVCRETISEEVYEYSKKHFGRALCMSHQKIAKADASGSSKITPQARRLSDALRERGIKNKLEAYDGYKHVDISIPWARLNIEIDGKQHLLNSKQLYSDLKRDSYSHEDETSTIRISNETVDKNLDELADSIARVARKRHREEDSDLFYF
jgi:very-short-patch-repair endonuclease